LPAPTVTLVSERNAAVWLTVEPDELCSHVDRMRTLGTLALTGGLGTAFKERFPSGLAKARSHREERARSHTWLITEPFFTNTVNPTLAISARLPATSLPYFCSSSFCSGGHHRYIGGR